MKIADIEHIQRIESPENRALRRVVIGQAEFDALCRTAKRGADDAVDPIVRQLERISDEMRQYLFSSPVTRHVTLGYTKLLEWQTTVELMRRVLTGESSPGPKCTTVAHYSIPGLDRCQCGENAMTSKALAGRPIVYAAEAPGYERAKCGDLTLVAVQLPPNCSINLDVDLVRGDAPAAPFISVRMRGGVPEIDEVDRG